MIKNQEEIKKELNDLLGASTDPKAIAAQSKIVTLLEDAGKSEEALEARTVDLAKKYREAIMGGSLPPAHREEEAAEKGDPTPKPKSFDECMSEIIAKRAKP